MYQVNVVKASVILLLLFLVPSNLLAQEKGELIILHPKVGKSLDWKECQRYGFFPEIKNIHSALFLLMPDSTYQVQISYFEDGILRRKVMSLSPETFKHEYYEVVEQQQENPKAIKKLSLTLKDGRSLQGTIGSVRNDTLLLGLGHQKQSRVSLKEIERISIIRHASLKTPLIISAVAGGVGVAIGLGSGSDKKGWYPMTAGEKALLAGIGLFSSALFIGGSIAAVKAVDIDIPLQNRSLEKQKQILNEVRRGDYKSPHGVRVLSSFDYLLAGDEFKAPAFSLRLQVQHKPRILFGFSYTRSSWSKWHIISQYAGETASMLDQEKFRFKIVSAEITALAKATGLVVPFLRWGLAINYRDKKTYSWYRYNTPETGVPQEDEITYTEETPLLAIPLTFGLVFNLHPNVSLELNGGKIWTEKAPWQFGLGLQIGQRAFHAE